MMTDVEETVKRIQAQKGVIGIIIMDSFGRPVRSTMDTETTAQHATLLQQLSEKSRNVIRELDASDDLSFIRLRTKKHEIMIAPDKDYLLAVVQNPAA